MGIRLHVSAKRAGKDRLALRIQMIAVLIHVTTVELVLMETTGTVVNVLQALLVQTAG